jgi:hypothetical protein
MTTSFIGTWRLASLCPRDIRSVFLEVDIFHLNVSGSDFRMPWIKKGESVSTSKVGKMLLDYEKPLPSAAGKRFKRRGVSKRR